MIRLALDPRVATLVATAAMLIAAAGNGQAQADPGTAAAARAAEVSPKVVEQKVQMVDRLLFNSPVAARVASSQSEDARRHLNQARDFFSQGRALAIAGQPAAADALLNKAIAELGRAQQLAPDQTARLVAERARYEQLSGSAAALLQTYQLGGGPGTASRQPDAATERNLAQAMAAIEKARGLADGGQIAEANRQLDQALALLLKDALQRAEGRTVVYDRRFASAADEYAYELARHRSLANLVPLAVLEYRPSREAQVLIDRYVFQAASLRERAEAQAAAADHAKALVILAEGTESLQRALKAAGLLVPQSMGTQ